MVTERSLGLWILKEDDPDTNRESSNGFEVHTTTIYL